MGALECAVLGPLEVRRGDRVLDVGARMPRALLAALILEPGVVVSQDRLFDALWGDSPPAAALGALHVYVSALRRLLEPEREKGAPPAVLVTQAPGYVLRVDPATIDAHRFATLIAAGRARLVAGEPDVAVGSLQEALALWRGTPYADLASEPFLQVEIARLQELRAGAWESLAEAQLAVGEHAAMVSDLERMANEEPLRERRWELLALALYRSGRQTEALRVLRQARDTLVEELGIEPGLALRRLEQSIFQHAAALEWRPPLPRPREASSAAPGTASRTAPSRTAPSRTAPGRLLVGREAELAQLRLALHETVAGPGRVALIWGEPGIGKTRLAEELAASAEPAGATVAWGRAPEGDAAPAYWPWVQIVRTLATEGDPEAVRAVLATDAEELARLVPEIKDLAGRELARLPDTAHDTARTRLYDAVVGFVLRMAVIRPLVLVIDDLHWADLQTLQLVQLLAARLSSAPVLLVATYRMHDAVATGPVVATLAALARVPELLRVQPGGLSDDDVRRLVGHATGIDAGPELAGIIRARTEGNPFFVSELLQLLQAKGQLTDAHHEAMRREIPSGVRDVIRQRLTRLPEAAVALLAPAAVAGRTFEVGVAAAASGVDEDRALELIESALGLGVVVEDAAALGSYKFSHSLVRETIYDGLSALRRARLHRAVGLVLAETAGADPDRAAEIADHFFAAGGDTDEAYQWAIRAADRAAKVLAFEQAEILLERAMDLARRRAPADEGLAFELQLTAQNRLASVRLMRYWYSAPEVGEAWTRAVELSRRVEHSPDVLPTVWGAWCYRYVRNDLDRAFDLAEEMRARAQHTGDIILDVVGNHCAGIICTHRGRLSEGVERFTRVGELLDQVPASFYAGTLFEPDVRLGHRLYPGLAACLTTGPEGCRILERGVEEARRLARPLALVAAQFLAALGAIACGERSRTDELAAEGVAQCEEHGFRLLGAMVAILGAWAASDPMAMREAFDEFEGTGSRMFLTIFWCLRAEVERENGRPGEALAAVGRGLALAGSTRERFWEPELHRVRGELAIELGSNDRRAEAETSFRTGLALAQDQGAHVLAGRLAARLADVAAP